jgi:hypothetical protein
MHRLDLARGMCLALRFTGPRWTFVAVLRQPTRAEFLAPLRHRSPLAFAGVLIILLLAVIGFAAFSATPIDTAQTADGVVLPPTASGRIAGSIMGAQLATSVTPATTEPPVEATEPAPEAAGTDAANSEFRTAATSDSPTTTLAPTTTKAPPTTTTLAPTTTTAPPTTTTLAPTTTTAPPTTTTTPPTTTTTPPTTTTTPPDTTLPPIVQPPAVEQWRALVGAYWPADLVDDALSVIACESNGDPSAVNPSSGATGLFQFLPSTWDSASEQAGWSGAFATDPEANIATAYWLYSQYSEPWQQWNCTP